MGSSAFVTHVFLIHIKKYFYEWNLRVPSFKSLEQSIDSKNENQKKIVGDRCTQSLYILSM